MEPINSINTAATANAARTMAAQVADQANVARPGANRRADIGGVANAFLHRLRGPAAVRVANFAGSLGATIVRLGKKAVDSVVAGFARLRQAHLESRQRAAAEAALPGRTFTFTHPQTGGSFTLPGSLFKDMIAEEAGCLTLTRFFPLPVDAESFMTAFARLVNAARHWGKIVVNELANPEDDDPHLMKV